jgi:dienelactone hydrolase
MMPSKPPRHPSLAFGEAKAVHHADALSLAEFVQVNPRWSEIRKHIGFVFIALMVAACASLPDINERRSHADQLTMAHNWQAIDLAEGGFDLVAYAPNRYAPSDALAVYIEGDGFAWVSGSQPSSDPTPRDPLALRLALAQPDGNAVYLARPCQYVDAERSGCAQRYWTESRFAEEVINATGLAIDNLKRRFGAKNLTLVGYSGGGAVAALVAARRNDVDRLITVAGNLDHRGWTEHHRIRALSGSLNAADAVGALQPIRQWHFVGARDKVIPPLLAESFAQLFPATQRPVVHVVPEFDHRCCWVENWQQLFLMTDKR